VGTGGVDAAGPRQGIKFIKFILNKINNTYNLILWRVRVIFIPPRLCWQPDNVSFEESAFMAIWYGGQKWNVL